MWFAIFSQSSLVALGAHAAPTATAKTPTAIADTRLATFVMVSPRERAIHQ
jgi:hypothetical protein